MQSLTKHERAFNELTDEELATLGLIQSPEDINNVELIELWTDDHEACVGVEVNGVKFGCWWIIPEFVGAFSYWDESARARNDIVQYIQEGVKDALEEKQQDANQLDRCKWITSLESIDTITFDSEDIRHLIVYRLGGYNHHVTIDFVLNGREGSTFVRALGQTATDIIVLFDDPSRTKLHSPILDYLKKHAQTYLNEGYFSYYD